MTGIKETKEALVGVNEIALLVAKRFKDGVQFDDFAAFWAAFREDAEFKEKVEAAYDKFQMIPEEVKDVDVMEGVELAMVQIGYVPKIIEALK